MFNDRPIEDINTQACLRAIRDVLDYYDLAGAVMLVNSSEWAYTYHFPTTWNAFINDESTPLGFRLRARQAELGEERAHELILGAAFVLTSMQDFGNQTRLWAQDLIQILKKAGVEVSYKPFNGQKLLRLSGMDMR